MAFRAIAASVLAVLLAPGVRAASFEYPLEVAAREEVGFEIPVVVHHAGRVVVEASWGGSRILAFRIARQGEAPAVRRSGPSPQRLHAEVAADPTGAVWVVTVRSLPSGPAAAGSLRIEVPDAPEVVRAREEAARPAPPPPPTAEPWTLPTGAPAGAAPEVVRFHERVEGLRARVLEGVAGGLDDCGWQVPLLVALADWRASSARGTGAVPRGRREVVARIVATIGEVEGLRTSTDPILAGPPPETRLRARAWEAVRRQRLRPLETALDDLAATVRAAPELEPWGARLVACLTACERSFEARTSAGPEGAAHEDLATRQWAALLLAAQALRAALAVP